MNVTLIHWGGIKQDCEAVLQSKRRVSVHFAHGHWLEFLLESGLIVGARKSSALDDGKGRLSKWRIAAEDPAKLRKLAAKTKFAKPAKAKGDEMREDIP